MASLDLNRLHRFVVLAEELHFRRAALRLRIAQPALSDQIKSFEEEIGATLINRGRGSAPCTLTAMGKLVAQEAAALLAQAEAAEQRIAAAARGQSGRLRLAYTRSARGGRVGAVDELQGPSGVADPMGRTTRRGAHRCARHLDGR